MKFLMVFLVVFPLLAHGQLEVGANYGICLYSLVNRDLIGRITPGYSEKTGNGLTLAASLRFKRKIVGIGYDNHVLPLGGFASGRHYYANPLHRTYLFAGGEVSGGRFSFQGSLLAGKAAIRKSEYELSKPQRDGWLAGGRFSVNYDIGKGFCANLTGSYNVLVIDFENYGHLSHAYNRIRIATIAGGLHYRLNFKHKPK